jgi:hypothetical protein
MTVFVQSLGAKGGQKNIYELQGLKRLYESTNASGVITIACGVSENFCIESITFLCTNRAHTLGCKKSYY